MLFLLRFIIHFVLSPQILYFCSPNYDGVGDYNLSLIHYAQISIQLFFLDGVNLNSTYIFFKCFFGCFFLKQFFWGQFFKNLLKLQRGCIWAVYYLFICFLVVDCDFSRVIIT